MKLELNEKAQNVFGDVRGIVKTVIKNSNVSEEVMRTARLFSNFDTSMKSTHQSLQKLTQGINELQERNNQILDLLYMLPQISEGLKIEGLVKRHPEANNNSI
ncbi:13467_t:CDS:2 [Cetraspora pellucida]|uniref:BLOC-1-related complex subunit 7 n=1 Tax=Cetraspora pellucida TaxID=1433469 RepID=A0A9N9F2U6_9GLOM|nr:13467_t:CDS:2 [Cetraspora pellucida]